MFWRWSLLSTVEVVGGASYPLGGVQQQLESTVAPPLHHKHLQKYNIKYFSILLQ